MSATAAKLLFWASTTLWGALWAVFVARLILLDARLREHVDKHHPHRRRHLSFAERLTWSYWFVFRSKEDYGDPSIGARRREMLSVLFDMVLVLVTGVVWLAISATILAVAR
jgi:hypothetical protein